MELAEAVRVLLNDVYPSLQKSNGSQAIALSVVLQYLDARCVHADCASEARTRIFWPGRSPARMCPLHTQAALAVASCVGLTLHVEQVQ